MKRWKVTVLLLVLAVTLIPLFQNCAPQPLGTDIASTDTSSSRTRETESPFPIPEVIDPTYDSTNTVPVAKANDSIGTVNLPADANVVWEWNMPSPVTSAHARLFNCPNSQYNQEMDFDWANGMRSGRIRGGSNSIGRAGCTHEVCFNASGARACVTVNYVNPFDEYARANGQSAFVARRADERVVWQWKLNSPVIRGESQHTDCKDTSRNSDLVSFDFANGTTENSIIGSSYDYRRDGCRHKVCFFSRESERCVVVDYHMNGGTYYARANGQAGVVRRPASQKTEWSFKTETPVVRATAEVTRCNDPRRDMTLTEFTWANGLTEKTELGSSDDPGRVGCHQEVCFHTASKTHCVMVIYQ